jgi:hypothetical protein
MEKVGGERPGKGERMGKGGRYLPKLEGEELRASEAQLGGIHGRLMEKVRGERVVGLELEQGKARDSTYMAQGILGTSFAERVYVSPCKPTHKEWKRWVGKGVVGLVWHARTARDP